MVLRKCFVIMAVFSSLCFEVSGFSLSRKTTLDGSIELVNLSNEELLFSLPGYSKDFLWYPLEIPDGYASGAFAISYDGMTIAGNMSQYPLEGHGGVSVVRWNYHFAIEGYLMGVTLYPEDYNSRMYNMSDNGDYIVGSIWNNDRTSEPGCYWDRNGNMHLLGSVSSNDYINIAYDVSDNGIIVGTEIDFDIGPQYAIIWDEEHGVRDLKEVLVNDYGYDFGDWLLSDAKYINPEGTYVSGSGYDQDGNQVEWEAVIPEPCSVLLLGFGVVLLRRRR